jgi:hypothetical protein
MALKSKKVIFVGTKARSVRRAGNLTAVCDPVLLTVGFSTSHTACYGVCEAYYVYEAYHINSHARSGLFIFLGLLTLGLPASLQ